MIKIHYHSLLKYSIFNRYFKYEYNGVMFPTKSRIIVTYSDNEGGAAIAANRLFEALSESNEEIYMLANDIRFPSANKIKSPSNLVSGLLYKHSINYLTRFLLQLQLNQQGYFRSLNIIPTNKLKILNSARDSVINLHWIGRNTISISEVSKITNPVVLTMHDSWGFCGSEHHPEDGTEERFIHGYWKSNKPSIIRGIDIDRIIWGQKYKLWSKNFIVVSPSLWMTNNVSRSFLFQDSRTFTIPNALPNIFFNHINKLYLRKKYNLPPDAKILFYGSFGIWDKNKGFDLLRDALCAVDEKIKKNILLITVGPKIPIKYLSGLNIKLVQFGQISDTSKMAELYKLADILCLPSRIENLSQVGTEAAASGLPIICFRVGGNEDLVKDNKNGFLIHAYDTRCFAKYLTLLIENDELRQNFSKQSSLVALRLWNFERIRKMYEDVYEIALGKAI
jgi:glycosyltransferase involved in cell wall biosynthesis